MAQTLEEFLVSVKYNIDAPSQATFFDAMKKAATSVAGVAGAMTGVSLAIMKLSETMAQAGEKLYWMSQRVGDSVTEIQGMSFALSNLGISAGDALSGIERFGAWTRNMGPAATGYLRSLGVTATDTVGRMNQLGEYFRTHGGTVGQQGTIQYAIALRQAQMMGLDERTMLALTNPNRAEMERQGGLIQRLVWGKDWQTGPQEFAAQSVKVMNQFRIMGFFFSNLSDKFSLKLFEAVLPGLKDINETLQGLLPKIEGFLTHLISYAPAAMSFLNGVIKAFGWLLDLASSAMTSFDELPKHMQHMLEALLLLPGALRLVGSPIFWLIAGFTTLLLLMDDYRAYLDDLKHPGEKPTAFLPWGTISGAFKPLTDAYKSLSDWMDCVLPFKGMLDLLAGGAVTAGILAITGALQGTLNKLMEIGAFLMFNPIGVAVMAAMGLLDVALFGKQGNKIVEDRAKELGYKIEGEGSGAPTFTSKDGRKLTYLEMMKEEGFDETGVTFGQSHGFRPLPWQPGYKKPDAPLIPDLRDPAKPSWRAPVKPGDQDERPVIYGQAGGDVHLAGGFGSFGGDTKDEFFSPERFYLLFLTSFTDTSEKLADILATLTAMATHMGVDNASLPGGGSGGGGGEGGDSTWGPMLKPGAPLEEQEARLKQIMQRESGGRNVWNYKHAENPNYWTASGYYQMIDSTWKWAAQRAGIDTSNFPHALNAPFELQHRAALALMNAQGEQPWATSAPRLTHPPLGTASAKPDLSHRPLGVDGGPSSAPSVTPDLRRGSGNPFGGLTNTTHITVTAPSPASAAAQTVEAQNRVFEHHIRYAKGTLLA